MTQSTGSGRHQSPDPAAVFREYQDAEQEVLHLRHEVEGLRRALETRPKIDIALGMVMAAERCSEKQAWQILVSFSQRTNIKVRTLAQHLTENAADPRSPIARLSAALASSESSLIREDRRGMFAMPVQKTESGNDGYPTSDEASSRPNM
ncbi:ANTAR domain-containing protein [Streptomyces sp. NPDC088719]|uniref:ANTAR domain-containing protein n=1 Tax=Streptomyces sp. NPDC088719 TaxID=3365872 RepID=UPI00380EE89E